MISMDYVSSVFNLDQLTDYELSQTFSNPCQLRNTIQNDQQISSPIDDQYQYRRRKSSVAFDDDIVNNNPNETKKKKKIMHRDIERQRRQEMATLYASLRSALPLEYLKGKRSISDHMHEAVKYIKHLQNKIQGLSDKREKLQRMSHSYNSSTSNIGQEDHLQGSRQDLVTVKPCWAGMEVVINTAITQGVPLSKVFQVLTEEGFSILNCTSTKFNGRLLHTIESEVSHGRNIDMFEIQQKLAKIMIIHPLNQLAVDLDFLPQTD
ncbi:Transcription factor [Quillaja saponaria]|uniref:Transcription factor n=1 Tax=Quillaja saponaria TaxID=32244 RepID=A0AAD7L6P4_QUISA|nr:Transcription factor [Quillaja saponaria]